jgi:hypothetical protein
MTAFIIAIVCMIAVALMGRNFVVWRRFENLYRFDGDFGGERYECILRFASLEYGVRCFIGVDASALYLLARSARKKSWWRFRNPNEVFRHDLHIPWQDLDCRVGRVYLKDCMWFHIPSRGLHFYVPRNIGDRLLMDAKGHTS